MSRLSAARRLAAALDPVIRMRHAGIEADAWQQTALRTEAQRVIILASRQAGKSMTVATKALHTAETRPDSEVIIGAVRQEQSAEMLRKAMGIYAIAGSATDAEVDNISVLRVELDNRSRIMAVPGKGASVRSYSAVRLLIIDEAAYVPDDFYQAVFPMLAVSHGRAILLSTANAQMGAFYDLWTEAPEWDFAKPADEQEDAWLKIKVPWWDCPRIRPEFIEAERRRFGDRYVLKEYCCEFQSPVESAFRWEDIARMKPGGVEAWDL